MIPLAGIGNTAAPGSPAGIRNRSQEAQRPADGAPDAVVFSTAAQEAARIAGLVEQSASEPDVRAAQVEAAKQNLQEGSYKVQEVVYQVAAVLTKFL